MSPQDFLLLDHWGHRLYRAFGKMPYLVGSVIQGRRDYRDVDVRMLTPDNLVMDQFTEGVRCREAINLGITLWGRQATGLPIDFQMQPDDEFHGYDGYPRGALGISTRQKDVDQAEQLRNEFLWASEEVWREVDRLEAEGPYSGIPMDSDLRQRERAAWERWKAVLDAN